MGWLAEIVSHLLLKNIFHADSGLFAVYKKNSELWVKLKYSF